METQRRVEKSSRAKRVAPPSRADRSAISANSHPLLALQRQAGNFAMQDLLRSGRIQAKLSVSSPRDPDEIAADRVADRVMRAPAGAPISAPCTCAEGEESCESCRQQSAIQRSANPAARHPAAPVIPSLRRENGRPLDRATRAFFEPRFGRDFGAVRVHTGTEAAESAQAIDARAYTMRDHIAFAPGMYRPDTEQGRHLLAHELAHTIQQSSDQQRSDQRLLRQPADSAAPAPANPGQELDIKYQAELGLARQNGDWQLAAELLNGFDKEDIQSRLAVLSRVEIQSMHDGAVANPRVGPDSQVAQLTLLASGGNRSAQLACVVRLGGCINSRDAGIPSTDDIRNYNAQCRKDSLYSGPDITPTDEECAHPPSEELSTGEKILLGGFLLGAAAVGIAAVVVVGAEVVPAVVAAVGEQYLAGMAFYYSNAIIVNEIGVFAVGTIIACEGNVVGLMKAIADDPSQGLPLLYDVLALHMNISIQNSAARRATVPAQILPQEEQTQPGVVRLRIVGSPQFEDQPGENGPPGAGGLRPPGGAGGPPKLPAVSPEELLRQVANFRGFGSSPPGIPEPDPKGIGAPMGQGYQTYAAIEILDSAGNQVRVGVGAYLGGGQAHGEAQAVAALRAGLPQDVDVSGGKMIVAVEKEPCGTCDSAIKQLASDLKLADYEVYVPTRGSLSDPTKSVTAKQAARTVFQGNRPPTTPRQVTP